MRIARVFVWKDGRPDEHEEIRSLSVAHHVTHAGARFELRSWDLRYPYGQERVTDAIYDEVGPFAGRPDGCERAPRLSSAPHLVDWSVPPT